MKNNPIFEDIKRIAEKIACYSKCLNKDLKLSN